MDRIDTIETPPPLPGGWPTDEGHATDHFAVRLHPGQADETIFSLPITTNSTHAFAIGQEKVAEDDEAPSDNEQR